MKIVNGTDIVEINRIQKDIEQIGERFLKKSILKKKLHIVNLKRLKNFKVMLQDLQPKKLFIKL